MMFDKIRPVPESLTKTKGLDVKKQQKYNEMLEMLKKISEFIDDNENVNYMVRLLSREVPNIKQLIKEATDI